MANVYQFSQSSLELLESCIRAASQPDTKWINLFKTASKEVITQENIYFKDDDTILKPGVEVKMESEEQVSSQSEQVEKICAILEAASSNKLSYLTDQCNPHLLPALAKKLTSQCIETICKDLLNNLDIQYEKIFLNFFPVYIKQENSCIALNSLIEAYEMYPDSVITLIESLFTNIDIPSKLLLEFFIAVDQKVCLQFLQNISLKELPTDIFVHHLNTIDYLYRNSSDTSETKNFILSGLLKSSQICQNNKNYGRLLLTFFQSLNETSVEISSHSLQTLLDCHKTPFKRACFIILSNINKQHN